MSSTEVVTGTNQQLTIAVAGTTKEISTAVTGTTQQVITAVVVTTQKITTSVESTNFLTKSQSNNQAFENTVDKIDPSTVIDLSNVVKPDSNTGIPSFNDKGQTNIVKPLTDTSIPPTKTQCQSIRHSFQKKYGTFYTKYQGNVGTFVQKLTKTQRKNAKRNIKRKLGIYPHSKTNTAPVQVNRSFQSDSVSSSVRQFDSLEKVEHDFQPHNFTQSCGSDMGIKNKNYSNVAKPAARLFRTKTQRKNLKRNLKRRLNQIPLSGANVLNIEERFVPDCDSSSFSQFGPSRRLYCDFQSPNPSQFSNSLIDIKNKNQLLQTRKKSGGENTDISSQNSSFIEDDSRCLQRKVVAGTSQLFNTGKESFLTKTPYGNQDHAFKQKFDQFTPFTSEGYGNVVKPFSNTEWNTKTQCQNQQSNLKRNLPSFGNNSKKNKAGSSSFNPFAALRKLELDFETSEYDTEVFKLIFLKDGYPSNKLNNYDFDLIWSEILNQADQLDFVLQIGRLALSHNGSIMVICNDYKTCMWVKKFFHRNENVIGDRKLVVTLIKRPSKRSTVTFISKDKSCVQYKDFLAKVKKYNPNLKMDGWRPRSRTTENQLVHWAFDVDKKYMNEIAGVKEPANTEGSLDYFKILLHNPSCKAIAEKKVAASAQIEFTEIDTEKNDSVLTDFPNLNVDIDMRLPIKAAAGENLNSRGQQGLNPNFIPAQDSRILPLEGPCLPSQQGPQDPITNKNPKLVSYPRLMRPSNQSIICLRGTGQAVVDSQVIARVESPPKTPAMGTQDLKALLPMRSKMPTGMVSPVLPINLPDTSEELKKTALMMQVLLLSKEQIAALPPERQKGILDLKEQISHIKVSL